VEDLRNNNNGPERLSSTIQVFMPNAWKIQQKTKLENSMEFFYEFIMVKNGPIYGYKLVAEKYI
jgi:hypothetical protein